MIEINLREFYPECYRNDYFVEVPDEVAELLILLRRHEQSQRRRIYKHRAHYSLDIWRYFKSTLTGTISLTSSTPRSLVISE